MRPSKENTTQPRARTVKKGSSSTLNSEQSSDLFDMVVQRAKAIALNAVAAGWSDPYDLLVLAEHLKIEFIPSADVRDARTVTTGRARSHIEFNPNQPLNQVCYSIAIEIARALFFGSQLERNISTDELRQIETLCRIAAAEFLIPAQNLFLSEVAPPDLDFVLALQKRLNISIEALLNRVAQASTGSCAMFCASRIESGLQQGRYKIDYAIKSRSWSMQIPNGLVLPGTSVVGDCSAIGVGARSAEQWLPGSRLLVECIGVSPLPGSTYPRVAGLLRIATNA